MGEAMCKPPEYNSFSKGTEKWTLDQWNDRRYNCVHHYAQYYANGRDSAETIADLVTNFDCASETERVVEAAMGSPNVMIRTIHSEPEMQKDTRYVAMEDVLTYRSNNCHLDVAHIERK
jgi:hypothetical protein